MTLLFTPYEIGHLSLRNRIVLPPMCMYSANNDGIVKPFHYIHYGTRAQGGVGLIILEATAVEPRGRISANDLGLWNDEQKIALKPLIDLVHEFNAKIVIQLGHAGRKAGIGQGISASPLQFSDHYPTPEEMTEKQIHDVVNAFGAAANRAKLIGIDAIELHGAHGYLINQFLSPLTNHRDDQYGGDFQKRLLFLKEIIEAVKFNFDGSIGLRISAEEFSEQGLHVADHLEILKVLQTSSRYQIDFVDVSTGGNSPDNPVEVYPGYQIPYAHQIKEQINIPIIAGGLITKYQQAEDILQQNQADLVWLGRELLRNPYWGLQAADYFNQKIDKPIQYQRAEPYLKE